MERTHLGAQFFCATEHTRQIEIIHFVYRRIDCDDRTPRTIFTLGFPNRLHAFLHAFKCTLQPSCLIMNLLIAIEGQDDFIHLHLDEIIGRFGQEHAVRHHIAPHALALDVSDDFHPVTVQGGFTAEQRKCRSERRHVIHKRFDFVQGQAVAQLLAGHILECAGISPLSAHVTPEVAPEGEKQRNCFRRGAESVSGPVRPIGLKSRLKRLIGITWLR